MKKIKLVKFVSRKLDYKQVRKIISELEHNLPLATSGDLLSTRFKW